MGFLKKIGLEFFAAERTGEDQSVESKAEKILFTSLFTLFRHSEGDAAARNSSAVG